MGAPEITAIVCVVFDEDGEISYRVFGDERVRLFIVDERAPHDRVYEWTQREERAAFRDLVPDGAEIGSSADQRHEATKHRILKAMDHRAHLTIIQGDPE